MQRVALVLSISDMSFAASGRAHPSDLWVRTILVAARGLEPRTYGL
jgi:hypothetical protein